MLVSIIKPTKVKCIEAYCMSQDDIFPSKNDESKTEETLIKLAKQVSMSDGGDKEESNKTEKTENTEKMSTEILKKALSEVQPEQKSTTPTEVEKTLQDLMSAINRLTIRVNELHSRIDDIEALIESSLRLTPLEKNLQWLSNILIADIARSLRESTRGGGAAPTTPTATSVSPTVPQASEETQQRSQEAISDEGLIRPSQLFKNRR